MQDHVLGTPEAGSPATWYGSAIHEVIDAVEEGLTDEAAIERAWSIWGSHLGPGDLQLLKDDIAKFHERDFQGVRTVLAEGEIRTPLCTLDDGREVWFRGRIDRLYERIDAPGHFIHVDYKSSKWLKNQDEVDEDLQLWAYNWALAEYFPEIEELEQWLDQLRGGLVPTRKTPAQRDEMHGWLTLAAREYFAERELLEDGLPAPRFNQWCPWCPILESCQIVPRLSDWALTRIIALRPPEMGQVPAETTTPLDEYMDRYMEAKRATQVLERYAESARDLVLELPEEERERLDFRVTQRNNSVIDLDARGALLERLGRRRFLEMAKVTQGALEKLEDEETRTWALGLVEKIPGAKVVTRKRR